MFRKIFAIPDIHGRADLLDLALNGISDKMDLSQDLLVFLGDMVDRGPDVNGVITKVAALREAHPDNVVALKGNHEDMLLDYYLRRKHDTRESREIFYMNGGIATERSYPGNRVSEDHVKFLGGLPYAYEVQGFFFSHAPVLREKARGRAPGPYKVPELTWTYFGPECDRRGAMMDMHEGPLSQKTHFDHLIGVCGHIHRGYNVKEVRIFPKYRMLDCGAGCWSEAPLAVHECISGETWYFSCSVA